MSDDGPRFRAAEEHVAEAPLRQPRRLAAAERRPAGRALAGTPSKFRAVAAGLIAIAVASIVVAISLSAFGGSSAKSSGGTWSAFSPQDSGLQGAQEIADFVSPYYRATPAYQLAVVTAMNLNDPSNPLEVVVPSSSAPAASPRSRPRARSPTTCAALAATTARSASARRRRNRLLLLRREALELALYTFKYIPGVHTVVAILPPGHTESSSRLSAKPPTGSQVSSNNTKSVDLALAFDRKELQPWLDRPLRDDPARAAPADAFSRWRMRPRPSSSA